nr:peptidoglycan-binding domain-containing protein [Clostridium botulinum]
MQYCLRIMCINTSNIDGIFGNDTYNAVLSFQRDNGFFADGMIRANTKANLFNLSLFQDFTISYKYTSSPNELEKFINIAETKLVITKNGNNITKYGAWYGMFVSWCANEVGILNRIVPKYASCVTGAEWYRTNDKYKIKKSGYISKTGDTIFFNRQGAIHHTSIVFNINN